MDDDCGTAVVCICALQGCTGSSNNSADFGAAKTGDGKRLGAPACQSLRSSAASPGPSHRESPRHVSSKICDHEGRLCHYSAALGGSAGADRFYNLVRHHFYDNTSFFRVLKGFVVQWGISAYPPVSAAWSRAPIKDDPAVQSNLRGYLTYAMGGPNTRTTQVFINLVDNKGLDDKGFSAFGQVTEGMDVVEALYAGYGEGAPDGQGPEQNKIKKWGKPYLDKGFDKLDSIKTTTLILPPGATPLKSPAAPKAAPTPATPKP